MMKLLLLALRLSLRDVFLFLALWTGNQIPRQCGFLRKQYPWAQRTRALRPLSSCCPWTARSECGTCAAKESYLQSAQYKNVKLLEVSEVTVGCPSSAIGVVYIVCHNWLQICCKLSLALKRILKYFHRHTICSSFSFEWYLICFSYFRLQYTVELLSYHIAKNTL